MGKTLYLECSAGISGDMFVAALLDLGADRSALEEALSRLQTEGARTEIRRVRKAGLDACDFQVILDQEHENHDHDMEYLFGHGGLSREEAHGVPHSHGHRSLGDVLSILRAGSLPPRAEELAEKIFHILAEAEGKAHGVPADEVHFHEVGALDSILDIAAAAVCMDDLDITRVIIPRICEGRGKIRCQHGILPIPVPAVVNIAEAHGLPLHIMDVEGEYVTPTGAAIAAAIRTDSELPEKFRIRRTGLGAGKREYRVPGILRAFLIEEICDADRDRICKLETNMDDCTGEALGYVMDRLMEAGARDVHYIPVYMKKNRPAWQLNVICTPEDVQKMEAIIFEETTTIGIRRVEMDRTVLERTWKTVHTPYGELRAKGCRVGEKLRWYPEYRDIAAAAEKRSISFQEVYRAALSACEKENG
jgi:uncharacterized protein (TIGR00299 family) protein